MTFWYDPKKRAIFFQVIILFIVAIVTGSLVYNTQHNLESQNIATGFGFLSGEAGFEISESMIEYWSDDTYLQALKVGFLNTLKVGVIGNILAIVLGVIIGVLRLSHNWPVAKLCKSYIEVIRNIPLLLQLLFWYSLFTEILPSVKEAISPISGVFLTQRGFYYPVVVDHAIWPWVKGAFLIGLLCFFILSHFLEKKEQREGRSFRRRPFFLGLIVLLPFLIWLVGGAPFEWSTPVLMGFNFSGGSGISPEFGALLLGLVLYTAAFNAEIVRAGILSVDKGQWEAAESLGLSKFQTLRFVILPQSLRVIIPPMTSQILNLIKNSSLAVGIGYPDYVAVANTTMNQTGQAIEGVLLIMAVYLFFSLFSSLFMNIYHKRIQLQVR